MKTSSAKAKGRRLATKVQQSLLKVFPDLTTDDIRVTPSGVPGPDLQLSAAAKALYMADIECKNQEKVNIWATWKQVIARLIPGYQPVVFLARNRQEPLVVLRLKDYTRLLFAKEELYKRLRKEFHEKT